MLEDQGRVTRIKNLVHTPRTKSRTESVIADLGQTGEFKKDHPKIGKDLFFEFGRSFYENTVPALRQVLVR